MTTAWAERLWSCSRFTRHTAGREPRRVGQAGQPASGSASPYLRGSSGTEFSNWAGWRTSSQQLCLARAQDISCLCLGGGSWPREPPALTSLLPVPRVLTSSLRSPGSW